MSNYSRLVALVIVNQVRSVSWITQVPEAVAPAAGVDMPIFRAQIIRVVRREFPIENRFIAFRKGKDAVRNDAKCSPRIAVSTRALPNDLTTELARAEDSIEQQFEVVTRYVVAMEIEAARFFQDAMQLDEARSHHREVSHHR